MSLSSPPRHFPSEKTTILHDIILEKTIRLEAPRAQKQSRHRDRHSQARVREQRCTGGRRRGAPVRLIWGGTDTSRLGQLDDETQRLEVRDARNVQRNRSHRQISRRGVYTHKPTLC